MKKKQKYFIENIKLEETKSALKGYTKSYQIPILYKNDPLIQLQNTRKAVEKHIIKFLDDIKGLEFIETLKVTFEKQASPNEKIIKSTYFNSKAQTIINITQIGLALTLSIQQILLTISQWISEGSGWTIQSIDNHYLNIVKYEPMKESSYIKLINELSNSSNE